MIPDFRFNIIVLIFLLPNFLFCQKLDHVLGDVLIQFHSNDEIPHFIESFKTFEGKSTQLTIQKELVPYMKIWQLKFDYVNIHESRFLEKIKTHPSVANAQFNHFVEHRSTVPDDPQFEQQWQYLNDGTNGSVNDADIDADLAWDITTGGLSPNGDTIVVCVIDGGIDHDHEDLVGNLWVNYDEIPNNGFDDDGNGFIDDRRGWNSFANTDNTQTNDDHGTPVNGIIGARGNNNTGVTGVNWNVKIMNVVGGSGQESEVLTSYSYPLSHRIKYNQTNGAAGAFVVVTNASWGTNMGQASDVPLWCAMYDTLGAQGILNCGATVNNNVDVDIVGDLPTTCPSEFLLGITNTTSSDEKSMTAGFGATSVDLAAPGDGSWTIDNSNGYNAFSGTSASCPHVAGAIALLYSAPCSNIASLALADPQAAAMKVRSYILDGVDLIPSLDGITVTGGRLNVFNSINLLMDDCGPCPTPSSLRAENITVNSAEISWVENDSTQSVNLRYRALGSNTWIDFFDVNTPFTISNLLECEEYEVQVEGICSTENSGYSNSVIFTSDGCCVPPDDISIANLTGNSATINWTPITAAIEYNITLTSSSPSIPVENFTTSNNTLSLTNLEECTLYQISIQTVCASGMTDFSDPIPLFTGECGTCLDANYCLPSSEDAAEEWIELVTFNTLSNASTSDSGYGNYTDQSTDVDAGQTYTLSITPGYAANNFLEYFRAWIDWNQDGDWDDSGELVLNITSPQNTVASEEVTIPMNAIEGNTRLRVMMRWAGSGMSDQPPCSLLDHGEYEDYCINVVGGTGIPCEVVQTIDTVSTSLTSAVINWVEPPQFASFNFQYREMGSGTWFNIPTPFATLNILSLEKCKTYESRVQTLCDSTSTSNYSEIFSFNTECDVSINQTSSGIFDVNIAPNPFQNNINLTFSIFEKEKIHLQILSSIGQSLIEKNYTLQSGTHRIDFDHLEILPPGIYFLLIKTEKGNFIQKVVKQ